MIRIPSIPLSVVCVAIGVLGLLVFVAVVFRESRRQSVSDLSPWARGEMAKRPVIRRGVRS
jgi:heme/copper-type cytochrome/quinol oxidase subunit 2